VLGDEQAQNREEETTNVIQQTKLYYSNNSKTQKLTELRKLKRRQIVLLEGNLKG